MAEAIITFCPDFPGMTVSGDRRSDTLTMMPIVLQRHVDETLRRGEMPPTPTAPDLWDVHAEHPSAIISFVEVVIGKD